MSRFTRCSTPLAGAGRAIALTTLAFAAGCALAVLGRPGRAVDASGQAAPPSASMADRAPVADAADQALAGATATRVYLPRLTDGGGHGGCPARVSVTSLGPEPTKAVLVLWAHVDDGGPECIGPSRVRCSGLLRAGSAWDFPLDPGVEEAGSGVLYSFTARKLSEIGVAAPGRDEVVADFACDRLAALVRDCAAYGAFAAVFAAGGTHFNLPLDRAAGSPLAAEVHRRCRADGTSGDVITSLYEGTGAPALGMADAASGEFRYHAAPVFFNQGGLESTVHIQNAGAASARVELWLQTAGACSGHLCGTVDIDPGASAVAAPSCLGDDWTGALTLRSTAPLAVVVDTRGRDALASFGAVAARTASGPTGDALGQSASAAYGPLLFDPAAGWDTEITVQNLDADHVADVRVWFLDAGGTPIAAERGRLCPWGSQRFTLPVTGARTDPRVGSVHVAAIALTAGTPAPAIGAVATLWKYDDAARSTAVEALAYNLVPMASAGWSDDGLGPIGPAAGSPVVALPSVWKDLDAEQPTTEIAVSNLVRVPGWTDVAVLVYDQNDLVNVVCRRLGAGQTTYIDPQRMGAIHTGFRGSAVVSATYWEHSTGEIGWVDPAPGSADRPADHPAAQQVGLAAAAVARSGTRMGEDIPGDEAAVAIGVPLARWPDPAGLPVDPCGMHAARPAAPPAHGHWQSVVPVFADAPGGTTRLSIRNDGAGPTEVRLHFQALGDCLRYRICTIGIPPRGSVSLDATRCAGPGWSGSVALHSREPLTVSAMVLDAPAPNTVAARPGRLPFDVDGDGRVDGADHAAIETARGSVPGGPGWNPRADLDANGVIDGEDLRMLRRSLCGADRDPDGAALALPRPRGDAAYVPVLHDEGDDTVCGTVVAVTNVGAAPTKPLLMAWGAAGGSGCSAPVVFACGVLLSPGGSFDFPPYALPPKTRSAVVFSFNATPLSALGASVGGDQPAADYLCAALPNVLAGDCAAYRDFKAAFDAGASFAGVPLGKAAGSAITASVQRDCQADVTRGARAVSAYPAVGGHRLGAPDPVTGMYETVVPLVYAKKAGLHTRIHVQNAGTAEATVGIATMPQDGCSDEHLCTVAAIGPGAVLTIDPNRSPAPCVSPDWQGSIRLMSVQPLAVVVDLFGRDVRSTYQALSRDVAYDAAGAPLPAGGRTTAYGPVFFDPATGWDTGIQVQNLSRTRPAHVSVAFLDAAGTPVETLDDYICPAGSQTFFAPVQDALAERRYGSVRVVSQPYAGDPSDAPAPIAAVANMFAYDQPWRFATVAAGAYALYSEREVLARVPGAAGGPATGVGAAVVPGIVKAGAGVDATSELVVTNLVPAPGWTDAAVLLYDANGLVASTCLRIDADHVAAVDLGALSGLPDGFRGSAFVSATAWHHPVGGAGRGPVGSLVGLGAVAVTRRTAPAGDALSVQSGVPLARVPASVGADAMARCAPATGTPATPEATATPRPATAVPTATPACAGCASVYLPYAEQWRP